MQKLDPDKKRMSNHGLGRGLDSLIPIENYNDDTQAKNLTEDMDINVIEPNPSQPRQEFNEVAMAELAESVKEHGILQPLLVTPSKNKFQVIAGERRLRAAKIAGLKKVPVIVRTMNEQSKLELALIENLQRENLNPMESAHSYKRLIDEFNLSQEDVAKRVGKARTTITNSLRLLSLPVEIKIALAEGKITEGHARAILAQGNQKEQEVLFNKIINESLSVRAAEKSIGKKRSTLVTNNSNKDPNYLAAEKRMSEVMETKVTIKSSKEKGKIIIDYFSFEDLERIFKRIVNS